MFCLVGDVLFDENTCVFLEGQSLPYMFVHDLAAIATGVGERLTSRVICASETKSIRYQQ